MLFAAAEALLVGEPEPIAIAKMCMAFMSSPTPLLTRGERHGRDGLVPVRAGTEAK